jgi:hypothetical protein
MKWRIIIVAMVVGLATLMVCSQTQKEKAKVEFEQAKQNLALEEARERIEVFRVVEEEVRLQVSIIENQIKLAKLKAALKPNPVTDPNGVTD